MSHRIKHAATQQQSIDLARFTGCRCASIHTKGIGSQPRCSTVLQLQPSGPAKQLALPSEHQAPWLSEGSDEHRSCSDMVCSVAARHGIPGDLHVHWLLVHKPELKLAYQALSAHTRTCACCCRQALRGEADVLASLAKLDLQQLDFQAGEVAKEPHEATASNGSLPPAGETIVLVVAEGLQVSLPLAGVQPSAGPDMVQKNRCLHATLWHASDQLEADTI